MRILLDTNVLCRLAEKTHPLHAAAATAVARLRDGGHELCLTPQVLYEYWVVVTRPASENGLGMSTVEVDKAIGLWLELFTLLRDERGVFDHWRELVVSYDVKGKQAHDARLAAAMKRHGVSHLATFNASDFRRYQGLVALDAQAAEAPETT
jgi:predicted nucleic acid-binding protein